MVWFSIPRNIIKLHQEIMDKTLKVLNFSGLVLINTLNISPVFIDCQNLNLVFFQVFTPVLFLVKIGTASISWSF